MLLFQDALEGSQITDIASEEKTLSVIDLIFNGGTGSIVIISVLFVMLAVALYIYFERLLAIKAASKIDKNFMNQIRDHVMSGKLEAAKILCAQTDSPVARLTPVRSPSRPSRPHESCRRANASPAHRTRAPGNPVALLAALPRAHLSGGRSRPGTARPRHWHRLHRLR